MNFEETGNLSDAELRSVQACVNPMATVRTLSPDYDGTNLVLRQYN
jgi:hypothetical protein